MDDKKYFYLDGSDKKGPFTKQEIIDLKLSNETLVFSEQSNNWLKYKEFNDFKEKQIIIETSDLRTRKTPKFIDAIVLIILVLSSIGISFYLTEESKKSDFIKLEEKIHEIFKGKDEICDFVKTGVRGKTIKVEDYLPLNIKGEEEKDVVEYFICESGGWTVYTLKKLNSGFDLIESTSNKMGFKVPETTNYSSINYGLNTNSNSYSIPTFRGSVQNAYDEAMEYLSVEKENKSYQPGSYNKIITFNEIYSDLHYIDNVEPTRLTNASANLKSWNSFGSLYIFNKNWIVWYKESGKHYEIVLDKEVYKKKLIINLLIGVFISILAFLGWVYILKDKIIK